ncbi:MAG: hypothetical protein RBT72_04295 [Spirochaetia bacterium]|nr:hypothetical protein [Spirochaetales bacterium]MDX9783957.1 hypothetical protein [Spirochaetia bacterium]
MKEITGAVSSWMRIPGSAPGDQNVVESQQQLLVSSPLARDMMAKLFSHFRKYGFSSADEAVQALLHYSGRLVAILRKSMEIEDKKEAYIDKSLRYIAKSVQRYNRKREYMDSLLANSSAEATRSFDQDEASIMATGDYPTMELRQFIGEISPSVFIRTMSAQNKRLLFLTVKCAWEVDDAIARKVAHELGIPALWLETLLHKARATLEPQRLCIERLCGRINEAWGRILYIEAELRSDCSPRARQELEQRIGQQRQRYYRLLARKSAIKPLVAHKDIAALLGIPKGSIDSGLYYLKEGRGRKMPRCA